MGERGLARAVLRLAVPALLALLAEPLFLLADAAVVGRLGTSPWPPCPLPARSSPPW